MKNGNAIEFVKCRKLQAEPITLALAVKQDVKSYFSLPVAVKDEWEGK